MKRIITELISNKSCFGCGLCVTACPKGAIELRLNNEGFYIPSLVNSSVCNKCSLCTKVCSYIDSNDSVFTYPIASYGAWSRDKNIRKRSSSGGVAFEVGKFLLAQGYDVCSVRYNSLENIAEHFIASSVEELIPSMGSKYIQSYTVNAFRQLDKKKKVLLIGTPCQIDSFRKYATLYHCEDNFVFVDFFCHGVPSKNLWDKYIANAEKIVGKVIYATWRNKINGWHDSWAIGINGESADKPTGGVESLYTIEDEPMTQIDSRFTKGDAFYRMFLEHHCLNEACHKHCKFKRYCSSADIRLGDFWGKTYSNNEDGVSSVLCFTEKGNKIIKCASLYLEAHTPETVSEGQLSYNAKASVMRPVFMTLLKHKQTSLIDIQRLLFVYRLIQLPQRVLNKIKTIIIR